MVPVTLGALYVEQLSVTAKILFPEDYCRSLPRTDVINILE